MEMVEKKALFSLKYKQDIIEGKAKVVTENDRPIEVVKWDTSGDFPILGLITLKTGKVEPRLWNEEGKRQDYGEDPMTRLYVLVDEPELSDFENAVGIELMRLGIITDNTYLIADVSKNILEAARKEIMNGWSKGLGDFQDRAGKSYTDGYNIGLMYGRTEARKDLPKWKNTKEFYHYAAGFTLDKHDGREVLCIKQYEIDVKELWEKLEKEEIENECIKKK